MNTQEVGALIKQKRIEKHMNQSEFADRLHVSRTAVSKWETGKNFPDLQNLEEISKILDIPLPVLLGMTTTEKRKTVNTKAILAVLAGISMLITIIVTSVLYYNNRPPEFTILHNFHGPYEDLESCCFIVTWHGKFAEEAWNDYTEAFREQYLDCFNQVEAIVIAGFKDYNEDIDVLDSAEYITVLYSCSLP